MLCLSLSLSLSLSLYSSSNVSQTLFGSHRSFLFKINRRYFSPGETLLCTKPRIVSTLCTYTFRKTQSHFSEPFKHRTLLGLGKTRFCSDFFTLRSWIRLRPSRVCPLCVKFLVTVSSGISSNVCFVSQPIATRMDSHVSEGQIL